MAEIRSFSFVGWQVGSWIGLHCLLDLVGLALKDTDQNAAKSTETPLQDQALHSEIC